MPNRPSPRSVPDQLLTERGCAHQGDCVCGRQETGQANLRKYQDILIIDMVGTFTGGEATRKLERMIQGLIDVGNNQLLIDCSRLELCTANALGVLTSAHDDYASRYGELKVCGLNERMQKVFTETKLGLVFETYPNEASALASFKTRRRS